jgi:pimeloyl-ACP methyl ester carboxylesterase
MIHFEIVGRRGQPTLFLHSWLGSWRYWLPIMDIISDRYRAYALDLWGFGESDRRESAFSLAEYVDMLYGFLDSMGLARVNLVGHGLGGMIAIRAASEQPERFTRLLTVGTPIQGASLQRVVQPGALSRLLGRTTPTNVWVKLARQNISGHHPREITDDLVKDTESLSETLVQRVLASILSTDLSPDLQKLQVPLLAVFGEKDTIVGLDQANLFHDDHSHLQQVIKMRASHFPFLDQPTVFGRLLTDFLAVNTVNQVELKTEWRRRVSQLEYL